MFKLKSPSRFSKPILAAFLLFPALAPAQQTTPVDTLVVGSPRSLANDGKLTQQVYKVNPWVSGGISVAGTLLNFYAIPTILHGKKDLSDAEFAALRPDVVNGIDRWALQQPAGDRDRFYKLSDVALPTIILASGGSLFFDKQIRKNWASAALMFYEAQAVTFTLYNYSPFGPAFQNRIRPYAYYNEFPQDFRRGGNQRNSMFSGHVANAATATFFVVKVYSDYHPEIGKKKYLYYALASVPPLVEGYFRLRALAHFPSDILMGFVIGAVTGVSVPALHKIHTKTVQFGVTYNEVGAGLGLTWKPAKHTFKALNSFSSDHP